MAQVIADPCTADFGTHGPGVGAEASGRRALSAFLHGDPATVTAALAELPDEPLAALRSALEALSLLAWREILTRNGLAARAAEGDHHDHA